MTMTEFTKVEGTMEGTDMKLGLEEWHKVIPHYRIPAGAEVPEHIGMQIGIVSLPLEW
jgi:hypothetical protein